MRRRVPAAVGILVGVVVLLLPGTPAGAQAGGPGAQATPVVGVSPTANCPTAVPAAQVAGTFTVGVFTVGFPSAGSCTSFSANVGGAYTVGGSAPLPFSADCQTAGLQNGGAVDVPAGTIVNFGQAGQRTTTTVETITTPNTVVKFPNGTVATLNVVTTTATSVTRTAIVSDGAVIGRVICGAANVYPLAVDTAAAAPSALPAPVPSSSDSRGPGNNLMLIAGAIAVLVLAQVAVGRKMWRRKGDATA
jgi:hypothetical protein